MSLVDVALAYHDATPLQEEDGIFLELFEGGPGEPPSVRGRDDIIPGRTGRSERNRVRDRRMIELRGYVAGAGTTEADRRSDFWANRLALEALFSVTANPRTLTATLPGSAVYTVSARTTDIRYGRETPALQRVTIELESIDPEWVLVP